MRTKGLNYIIPRFFMLDGAVSTWAGVRCASELAKRGAGMFSAFDARSGRQT